MSIRVGIIGAGVIAQSHLKALQDQTEIVIAGIADIVPDRAAQLAEEYKTQSFTDHITLLKVSRPDYVMVCTPHYTHMPAAIDAMRQGVHALVEKPMAVTASQADAAIQVSQETGCLLGVNYNMRPRPERQKMVELISQGFLGRLLRVTMVDTEWFRSMAYYRSSAWRATWAGEGGGVLVNQAPHDLDMLTWAAGQPCAVQAWIATVGHAIEVDDTMCAVLRWANGAVGTIQANTTEYPGQNYLEIAGTKGFMRLHKRQLTAVSLSDDSQEISNTAPDSKTKPAALPPETYDLPPVPNSYLLMHQNFVAALQGKEPLICSAEDGLKEVELANALMVSGIEQRSVSLPVDRARVDALLAELCQTPDIEAVRQRYAECAESLELNCK